jgi:hypothetical protein
MKVVDITKILGYNRSNDAIRKQVDTKNKRHYIELFTVVSNDTKYDAESYLSKIHPQSVFINERIVSNNMIVMSMNSIL